MDYNEIVEHYEKCFEKFGDTPQGVDWTKEEQVEYRYQVMLELINFREKSFYITQKKSLLDYGCGLSHLYEYIEKNNIDFIDYTGLEISSKFFNKSKQKFPENKYILGDILKDKNILVDRYDYIVMNGVFTEKRNLSYESMFDYFEQMIISVYQYCNKGIAFNVMSKQVDWEIDTLFHVPLDDMANFLTKKISRNFIIRNDYGLYEYTVYLYK
ncbi:class I SAM-dependent methyltransferase [Wolinella succinogenes]|uniref:class I SAM-dependent methyltransferase n=1 Tax=Wolinella succinogenes TaxID=844 RepID=UPI0024095E09|nr:class I SAM-dependent methyltransferase [Wolinella succinogenes]